MSLRPAINLMAMSRVHTHEGLLVWQRGLQLVEEVYRWSKMLPPDERFGICAQVRRASVSVVCNIAEGAARATCRDKSHFFVIARGSVREVETLCRIVVLLNYVTSADIDKSLALATEVAKMLNGLRKSLHLSNQAIKQLSN
jgi:four helix bundle protein